VWKLDENSGIVATDSSLNNNDGQLNGGVAWETADCKYAPCGKFDGSNDYISTPALNVGSKFTVDFWMKPLLLYDYGDPLSAGTTDHWLTFVTYADGRMAYGVGDGTNWGNYIETTPGIFNNNQWYHIAGTYDGTNIELFINGTSYDTRSSIGYSINQPFNIGSRPATGYWFNGIVDEPRIWNKALTQGEIISLMNQSCQ